MSFVLQAVALSYGELSAVEPIITLEVPLTLLVASRVFSGRLSGYDWASILIMTGGMIVLVWSLDPSGGDATNVDHLTYVAAGTATAATIVVLILASHRGGPTVAYRMPGRRGRHQFRDGTATLIKVTVEKLSRDGAAGMLVTWQTYAAACFGILGLVLVQAALHEGPLVAAQPGFTLMDPLVSILWGVLVFNEVTQTGGWLVLATLGAAGSATACSAWPVHPCSSRSRRSSPDRPGAPPGRKPLTTGLISARSAGTGGLACPRRLGCAGDRD